MATLLGFVLGILASYVAWWVNAHLIVPKVAFSEGVARRQLQSGDKLYQVAFENCGRRKIVDVEILTRIGIKGFGGAKGWGYHAIRTNASKVPDLSAGEENRRLVRVFDTRDPIEFLDNPSKSIRDAMLNCRTLEELLGLGAEASVRVHVFGFDAFSGTRVHFASKKYVLNDVEDGRFDALIIKPETRRAVYISSSVNS